MEVWLIIGVDTTGHQTYNFGIHASGQADIKAFGFTFASVGISFDATATGSGGSIDVRVSVGVSFKILFVRIHATVTFDLGTIQLPETGLSGRPCAQA